MSLEKVGLRFSPLTKRIVLARFGKDPELALERKDAMNEFLQILVQFAFDGKKPEAGESVEVSFGGGEEQFLLCLSRKAGA